MFWINNVYSKLIKTATHIFHMRDKLRLTHLCGNFFFWWNMCFVQIQQSTLTHLRDAEFESKVNGNRRYAAIFPHYPQYISSTLLSAIKQIIKIVRDAVQHTAGGAVASAGHHNFRCFLLAIGLFAFARVGDVRDCAHHVLPTLQFYARSRWQFNVALHGQRDIRHGTQTWLHIGAAEYLGRRFGGDGSCWRQEDFAVATAILGDVTAETATVTAVSRRLVDTASTATCECRINEHRRFLILARARAVVLEIDVVRMVHPDFRQESASQWHGRFGVDRWRLGYKLAHVYATRCDTTHFPIWLVRDRQRRRWSCRIIFSFCVSFRTY